MSKNRKGDRFDQERSVGNDINVEERFENPEFSEEDIRRNLQMDYQSSHSIVDTRKKPDNVVYQWGREIVRGMPDPDGVRERARLGWTPVPLSRHPEFMVDARIDGGENNRSGIIRAKGDILFERDIKWHNLAAEKCEERNFEALDAIRQMEKETGIDPRFITPGLRQQNSVTISRNKSFG